MAPFDSEFYLIINVAVGGVNGYFPDNAVNGGHDKPWENSSGHAAADFWSKKDDWYPTWSDDSSLQIRDIKVYQN